MFRDFKGIDKGYQQSDVKRETRVWKEFMGHSHSGREPRCGLTLQLEMKTTSFWLKQLMEMAF